MCRSRQLADKLELFRRADKRLNINSVCSRADSWCRFFSASASTRTRMIR